MADPMTDARTWLGIQYESRGEMLSAVADAWITADGNNGEVVIHEHFETTTDEVITEYLIENWPDENYTAADLLPHIRQNRAAFMLEWERP
jgi:hypothetical protein